MNLGEHLAMLARSTSPEGKPALVVQGGAMRGIYSMGALAELEDAGLRDAFGVVVGSSAGAINGAFFLAGQANLGLQIYLEDLVTRRFINSRRLWRVVDVDYLVDDIIRVRRPLDLDAIKAAPMDLLIVLTDAETGEAHVVSTRDGHDLFEVLRATSALPALYNKRITLDGRQYIDGGIVAPVPVEQALATGREALVVMTRAFDFKQDDLSAALRRLGRLMAYGHKPFVKDNISRPSVPYSRLLAWLKVEHTREPRTTWTVAPELMPTARTTISAQTLRETADLGRRDLRTMLETEYRPS